MTENKQHIQSVDDEAKDSVRATLHEALRFADENEASAVFIVLRARGAEYTTMSKQFDRVENLGQLDLLKHRIMHDMTMGDGGD